MPRGKEGGGFSGPLSAIAVASIALGVVVMVMAVCILRGFQGEIAGKVVGFGSHLTVSCYEAGTAWQENPVRADSALLARLRGVPGVRHLQLYATKGGMVKTGEQIHGILYRGLDPAFDTSFFASCLVEGRLPDFAGRVDSAASAEVLVSTTMASMLQLKVGDKMRTYFWQNDSPRPRAFTICGLYNTDLREFDESYVVGDLRQVQKLNDWLGTDSTGAPLVGGIELLVDDFDHLDRVARRVVEELPYDLRVQTIVQQHPSLFSWLDLLNSNITLILTIMCLVSAIAIVSALLIMIFEKSVTIGVLKTLGADNASVRRIFMLRASRLIVRGVAAGLAVAWALAWAQSRWGVVRLDPESYSMSQVPVDLNPWVFLLVGVGTAAVCVAALLLPAAYISHISPAKTVRTE